MNKVTKTPTRAEVVEAMETLRNFGRVGVADPPGVERRSEQPSRSDNSREDRSSPCEPPGPPRSPSQD